MNNLVTVSIISHGHGSMVELLIPLLLNCKEVHKIILIKNIPEFLSLADSDRLQIITNTTPKGFGQNHNLAFSLNTDEFFCIVNPDIFFDENPFPGLISVLKLTGSAAAAPLIISPSGYVEDSVRYFPTITSLIYKLFLNRRGEYRIDSAATSLFPEWVGGMFIVFKSKYFRKIKGFDESYFLYYEDVDICTRLWKEGFKVVVNPEINVTHFAQRKSHKNLKFMIWHMTSMVRYVLRYTGRLPKVKN
ncbi:glycosyltransferase family 2 protein [Polynucleobacter nymphae]|uniref:glycosyltransferase family 2 protein n=1 Tax=Polynucleobacter nymphae TaxID=2081043 RepID=UPI001C0C6C36|nr:glycosyltransferase [Polynucleobacter nymphae]MBU3607772.1 glycosyltransferase family 2 protein [Polynucleobacter nymphae]